MLAALGVGGATERAAGLASRRGVGVELLARARAKASRPGLVSSGATRAFGASRHGTRNL
jgi:hypothetical protein